MTRESAGRIEEQAAAWLMRIDREGRTPALAAELDQWLAGDSRRGGALLQAEAAWAMLDGLGGESAGAPGPEPRPFDHLFGDEVEELAQSPVQLSRRWLLTGGGAAIAASVAGAFFLLHRPQSYGTAIGEIRQVPLSDGSTAAINTRSLVSVAFQPKRRVVRLVEGEAWFQVAKDRSRPFLVEAGKVRVQAVGTAFSVRRRDGGADVLVTEGVVEAWADGADGHRIRLAAGERAFIADNSAISESPPAPSEVDRALAWRGGKIDLAGEPLSQAAAEFNRYNARQIVIADPAIAGERFYGIFRTNDPEGFALAVRSSLEVPVDASRPDTIRIGR